MSPNDADGMANSVDPDQTAPLKAVWSGSALFAQAYLSENLGSLRYTVYMIIARKSLYLWNILVTSVYSLEFFGVIKFIIYLFNCILN